MHPTTDCDDLQPVALLPVADGYLFHANGLIHWTNGHHVQNHYALHAYYFITEADSTAPTITTLADSTATTTAPLEITTFRAGVAFDPQEYERVAACSGAERDELFFRYWVLKESFMKATGEGLSLGSSSFHLEFGPPVCVIKDGTQQNYRFLEGDIPGYRYAVCLEGDLPEVQKEIADLREIL